MSPEPEPLLSPPSPVQQSDPKARLQEGPGGAPSSLILTPPPSRALGTSDLLLHPLLPVFPPISAQVLMVSFPSPRVSFPPKAFVTLRTSTEPGLIVPPP